MMLTSAQKTTLKTAIQANSTANALMVNGDLSGLADLVNLPASPSFWVWRTNVTRAEVYTKQNDLTVSGEQTGFFKWEVFKAQSAPEQTAFIQMFMGDQANFSLKNLRDGIVEIFKGTAANLAMQAHILAIGRQTATFAEKALATGAGSTASPATRGFEGTLSYTDFIGLPFQA